MEIKANPILGMILSRYGLLLNDKGLYRKIHAHNGEYYHMLLTDDMDCVAKLFDIDKEEFEEEEFHEQLENIYNSPYFKSELFSEEREDSHGAINMMCRYVSATGHKNTYLPIDTNRLMEVLGDNTLKEKIDYLKEKLPIAVDKYKAKFGEMKYTLLQNGYDPRNFQNDLEEFRTNFENRFDMFLYFYETDMSDIIEKYLSGSKVEVNI